MCVCLQNKLRWIWNGCTAARSIIKIDALWKKRRKISIGIAESPSAKEDAVWDSFSIGCFSLVSSTLFAFLHVFLVLSFGCGIECTLCVCYAMLHGSSEFNRKVNSKEKHAAETCSSSYRMEHPGLQCKHTELTINSGILVICSYSTEPPLRQPHLNYTIWTQKKKNLEQSKLI